MMIFSSATGTGSFVCNFHLIWFHICSDVVCEFPLAAMLTFHRLHGGEGTVLVTKVDDPSKFGVVVADEKGKIDRFVGRTSLYFEFSLSSCWQRNRRNMSETKSTLVFIY